MGFILNRSRSAMEIGLWIPFQPQIVLQVKKQPRVSLMRDSGGLWGDHPHSGRGLRQPRLLPSSTDEAISAHELTCSTSGRPVHLCQHLLCARGLPGWLSGKEPTCQCRRLKRRRFHPWVGKIPWRRTWQPTPVFLPRKSSGQRSLVGYSPWGGKESDAT